MLQNFKKVWQHQGENLYPYTRWDLIVPILLVLAPVIASLMTAKFERHKTLQLVRQTIDSSIASGTAFRITDTTIYEIDDRDIEEDNSTCYKCHTTVLIFTEPVYKATEMVIPYREVIR